MCKLRFKKDIRSPHTIWNLYGIWLSSYSLLEWEMESGEDARIISLNFIFVRGYSSAKPARLRYKKQKFL